MKPGSFFCESPDGGLEQVFERILIIAESSGSTGFRNTNQIIPGECFGEAQQSKGFAYQAFVSVSDDGIAEFATDSQSEAGVF